VFAFQPVGPPTQASAGQGRAVAVPGHDYGNDVGIPWKIRIGGETVEFEDFAKLERAILAELEKHFGRDAIKACMEAGKRPY
jgi:hypothetical protein